MCYSMRKMQKNVEFHVCYMQAPTETGADPSVTQNLWYNSSASLRGNAPVEGTDTDRDFQESG